MDFKQKTDLWFAWELGSALGHASRFRALAQRAMDQGGAVRCLAIRKEDAQAQLPCLVEEAPWLRAPKHETMPYIGHLGDTLAALGWTDADHLREVVRRWRERLEQEPPACLVMDSAPFALLASQGLPMKRVWLADAWNTPPDRSPLPDLAAQCLGMKRPGADTEPALLESINTVLIELNQPPIDRLAQLFQRVDLMAMMSFEEIDPHGPRTGVTYRGIWGAQPGDAPGWPASATGDESPGIFAYLKPFPMRAAALRLLASTGLPTIAYIPQITDAEKKVCKASTIRLIDKPIDWRRLEDRLAMVVCHASPGMLGQSLQMGVPAVGIPLSLEQTAIARRATQSGAVFEARHDDAESIRAAIFAVLSDPAAFEAAERIAQRYAGYDPDREAVRLADEIIELCNQA